MRDEHELRAELDHVRRMSQRERAEFRAALDYVDARDGEPETPLEYAYGCSARERADFRRAIEIVEANPTGGTANALRLDPSAGGTMLTGTVPLHIGPDALEAWQAADSQATRLAPAGIAPQFLAEAIWLRTLAVGRPTDAEVDEYVARCAADHRPISGRAEDELGIQPIEWYVRGRTVIEARRRGRGEYVAIETASEIYGDGQITGTRKEIATAGSRAKLHRRVEEICPGGTWSSHLLSSEVATIRKAWGL